MYETILEFPFIKLFFSLLKLASMNKFQITQERRYNLIEIIKYNYCSFDNQRLKNGGICVELIDLSFVSLLNCAQKFYFALYLWILLLNSQKYLNLFWLTTFSALHSYNILVFWSFNSPENRKKNKLLELNETF